MKRAVLAVTLALSACATPYTGETYVDRGPAPTADQADAAVRGWLAANLKDPESLKQFAIVYGPVPVQWYRGLMYGGGNEQGWLVCFQYNAKNSYGAYTGVHIEGVALQMTGATPVVVPAMNVRMADRHCPGV